jgi:hypothetical protein
MGCPWHCRPPRRTLLHPQRRGFGVLRFATTPAGCARSIPTAPGAGQASERMHVIASASACRASAIPAVGLMSRRQFPRSRAGRSTRTARGTDMTRADWSRPLPRPIVIPDVMALSTLADACASHVHSAHVQGCLPQPAAVWCSGKLQHRASATFFHCQNLRSAPSQNGAFFRCLRLPETCYGVKAAKEQK